MTMTFYGISATYYSGEYGLDALLTAVKLPPMIGTASQAQQFLRSKSMTSHDRYCTGYILMHGRIYVVQSGDNQLISSFGYESKGKPPASLELLVKKAFECREFQEGLLGKDSCTFRADLSYGELPPLE